MKYFKQYISSEQPGNAETDRRWGVAGKNHNVTSYHLYGTSI
jgi:hypothetical protein